MESRHHHSRERVRRKRLVDVGGCPGAAVHEVSRRHYCFDELALEPLLDIVHDLARDRCVTAGVKLLCKEPDEIAITSEVSVRLDQIAGKSVADDLRAFDRHERPT
jgi:hypothetical protein